MKREIRQISAKTLAAAVLITMTCPAFAQNYQYQPSQYLSKQQTQTTNTYKNQNYQNPYSMPKIQGSVTYIPVGAVIGGAAPTNTISSQYTTVGDTVTFVLNQPYYFNGIQVLPAGTAINGNVVIAQKAGMGGSYGKLKVMFNSATLPNGQRLPLSGKIATNDGTGLLVSGTSMDRAASVAKNTAVGAGSGALVGLVASAISGGKKGKGTAIMTGVGAGAGLLKSGFSKGDEVYLEAGQAMDIVLDQPMSVTGGTQNYNYNNYNY